MTALNFFLDPAFVTIVSDTLCCAGPKNRPYIFNSKIQALPHLHAAFVSTGQGLFSFECYRAIMVRCIARDLPDIDKEMPDLCRELWEKHVALCASEGTDVSKAKTSIYLFGWAPSEGRMIGLEYKLGNNFKSERIRDGVWLHPDTVADIVVCEPSDLVRITLKQKEIDDSLEPEKRAGIGGDVHLLHMTKEAIVIQPAARTSDFDVLYREMEAFAAEVGAKQAANTA